MARRLLIVFAVLILGGCDIIEQSLLAYSEEDACGFSQDSYGRRISWKDRRPVELYISKSWPDLYLPSVEKAVAAWNDAYGAESIRLIHQPDQISDSPQRDQMNGLYWLETWSDDKSNVQGMTTMQVNDNQFEEGDVKINAKNFRYYTDPPSPEMQVHMESLLIHEFGHLLGLMHSTTPPTVMLPTLPYNLERTKISDADTNSLNCEYGNAK